MLEINNLTDQKIDKRFLENIVERVLKGEKKKIKELSLALVEKERIKELNKTYRAKNRPTDVLAFNDKKELKEIIISPSEVKKNAKKFKISFKKELTRVLIHGLLHILGYEHEKNHKQAEIMEKKQEKYLSLILKNHG
jgi:probable rRNA maturation factor